MDITKEYLQDPEVSSTLKRFLEQLQKISGSFIGKGAADAAAGKPAPSRAVFTRWTDENIEDPELATEVAALLYRNYMQGYSLTGDQTEGQQ